MNVSIPDGQAGFVNLGKISNYSNDILIALSRDFDVTFFNRQAEKLYGLSAEDILGKKYDKTCEHNKINCIELMNSIHNALSNKSQMSIEENLYDNVFIKWRIIPTETTEDKKSLIILIGKDISEYHNINAELIKIRLETEKRDALINELENSIALIKTELRHEKDTRISLENLLAHMPGNVYWMDKNCIQLGCNDNVLTMLGLSRENYIGKTYEELSQIAQWPEGLAEKLKKDDIEVMRTGRPKFNIEDPPLPHSNGTFLHLLTSRVPLRDTENNIIGVAGISIDITERKKAEQELLRAKEAAEAANKAKTEFVQNMQHDIRTPTSGLVGVLDVLVKAEEDTNKREIFEMAAAASKRLLNLCNEAVEFGDLSGNTRPVIQKKLDVRELVRSIIDLNLPAVFAKNLVINFNITASVPLHIASDEFRISRILVNLLGNAIKFSHQGEITLSIDASVDEDTRKGFLTIELRDMGIGIAPDKVYTIFEKFTRGVASNTNLYPGTGLGLYIVKTFIDELDGEIEEVESYPNEGTYFKLNIPFKALLEDMKKPGIEVKECFKSPINLTNLGAEAKQIPKAAIQKKPVADTPFAHDLLIIEDDKTCLFAEKNLLSTFTHSIDTAENVAEALEKLSKKRYDLVISDLGLPDGLGNDIVAKIKASPESPNYKTPFVAMTAHQDMLKHQQAIDAGFTATNTKPLHAEKATELLNTYPAQKVASSLKQQPGLPVIDLNLGLKRTKSTSESGMIELLGILWESLQVDIPILKKAEKNNDIPGVNAILLKIRGALCYSGTPRLEMACEALYNETLKGIQSLSKIENLFSALYDEAGIFSEQFKELIKGINAQE